MCIRRNLQGSAKFRKVSWTLVFWDTAQDTRCPRTHIGVLGRHLPRTLLCAGTRGSVLGKHCPSTRSGVLVKGWVV